MTMTTRDVSVDVAEDAVDRAMAAMSAAYAQTEPCARCDGKGYHLGFGEHGHDPDWCDVCGGPGYVGVVDERAAMKAAIAAALAASPPPSPEAKIEGERTRASELWDDGCKLGAALQSAEGDGASKAVLRRQIEIDGDVIRDTVGDLVECQRELATLRARLAEVDARFPRSPAPTPTDAESPKSAQAEKLAAWLHEWSSGFNPTTVTRQNFDRIGKVLRSYAGLRRERDYLQTRLAEVEWELGDLSGWDSPAAKIKAILNAATEAQDNLEKSERALAEAKAQGERLALGWRCFTCGLFFDNEDDARRHFTEPHARKATAALDGAKP
jgi:hypothetical protein